MRRLQTLAYGLLLLCSAVVFPACSNAAENSYELKIGAQTLLIEVATTPDARSQGLMYRESLAEDAGMLFVFPTDRQVSFWMKNTSIPLSIAYLRRDGTILEIHDLQPFSLDPVPSAGPVRYALEVNQGWFERNGVTTGMRVELPQELPPVR